MGLFNNPNRIPINYGMFTAVGLTIFFLFMRVINQAHNIELRLLNLFILAGGIYFGLKKIKETHDQQLDYFRALAAGVTIGAIGSGVFSVFLFLYMKLDSNMMQAIIKNEPMGQHLNAYMAAFVVSTEGFFSGLILTFILINYMATDRAQP
jgi:hypothetical protein